MWSEILSKTIQQILLVISPVLAASATAFLINLAKRVRAEAEQAAGEEWVWLLDEGARIAVRATEQLGLAGLVKDKKEYAMNYLCNFLTGYGIEVDLAVISGAIEAAVLEEFNRAKLVK